MTRRVHGDAGNEVVIESYLDGPEISVHALSDGTNYAMLPPSQDHKTVGEGNTGKNTGGMGTIAPLPSVREEIMSDIERQIDYVLAQYTQKQLDQLAKVSIYTASSSLDQECLPTRSLMYLALRICDLPQLRMVSLETRPEYVEDWELKALRHVLGERITLEIGIGYETHDPDLRNRVLGKGLTVEALHRLLQLVAANGASLKAYLMLKPHYSLSEEAGVSEAMNGVNELAQLGKQYGVPVAVHLNPTYIARGCRLAGELVAHHFAPPELASVIAVGRAARGLGLNIYAGLDDEGLAVAGGTFRSTGYDRARAVAALQAFNRHQDGARLVRETAAAAAGR